MTTEIDWREIADNLAQALMVAENDAGEGYLSRPLIDYWDAVKRARQLRREVVEEQHRAEAV